MDKKDFLKQYQSKEWYEISKRIKARDHNTCQMCGCNDRPLSVHHRYYGKDGSIFTVPDDALVTLCEVCHTNEHEAQQGLHRQIDELKERFAHYGLSVQYLECMLSQIDRVLELYEYGEDIHSSGAINLFGYCLYYIQIYTDIVACKKIGIDCRELVEHAYPEMLASYDKVKCGMD